MATNSNGHMKVDTSAIKRAQSNQTVTHGNGTNGTASNVMAYAKRVHVDATVTPETHESTQSEQQATTSAAQPTTAIDDQTQTIKTQKASNDRNRNLPDAWGDALTGLRRTKGLTIWSIVTIALTLFLVGTFIVSDIVINDALSSVEDEVTISAYVDDNADQTAIDAYVTKLKGLEGVRDVTIVTKDEAWERYKRQMGEESANSALAALDGVNPLPASIEVTMNEATQVASMADAITADPDFAAIADGGTVDGNVSYGKASVEKLLNFTNTIKMALIAFIVLLVGVACVLISNTIRNSIASRSEEIGIMRLVGASKQYIRRPFVYEGLIQATVGALIAVILLIITQSTVLPQVTEAIAFIHFDIDVAQLVIIYVGLVVLGIVLGVASSSFAMRKHLTV